MPLSEIVLPAPLATAGDYSLYLLLLYAKALALLVAILFVASAQAFQLRYRPDEIYLAIRRGLVESSSGSVDGQVLLHLRMPS